VELYLHSPNTSFLQSCRSCYPILTTTYFTKTNEDSRFVSFHSIPQSGIPPLILQARKGVAKHCSISHSLLSMPVSVFLFLCLSFSSFLLLCHGTAVHSVLLSCQLVFITNASAGMKSINRRINVSGVHKNTSRPHFAITHGS
jgi:hypothetical protein